MKPAALSSNYQLDGNQNGTLAHHLQQCTASLGPGFRMHCIAESVHAFIAPRFVTTVCICCLVIVSATMAF